jgi:hypothetical protein
MIKLTAVMLSIGLLVGCAQDLPVVQKEQIHPSWPEPIAQYEANWQVKVIDGKAWVGMPFEESQELRIWLNDVKRYVHDQKSVICYYRIPLKEERCKTMTRG